MSKATDTEEAIKFQGTISIISSYNPELHGAGNIEIEGSVFTDIIVENTINTGVNIEGVLLKDNYITLTETIAPSNPNINNIALYIENGILKGKNSSGNVTIFQTTITKGDLLTHDGTVQVRLPVGTDGYALIADSSESSGLRWGSVSGSSIPLTTKGDLLTRDASSEVRLAIGTNNQILVADSTQTTGMRWSDGLTTKGDLLSYSTTQIRLPVGTNNQVLIADSTQTTGLRWGSVPSDLTTKGDLLAHNGSDQVRLPVGVDGYALIADSSESSGLRWGSVSGSSIPLTAKGDLQTFSTTQDRLPVGTNNQVLVADSTETTGLKWVNVAEYYYISDTKNTGTNGGTANHNIWQQRTLNTIYSYPINLNSVVLSGSNMTFTTGTYKFFAKLPFQGTRSSSSRLYNITSASVTLIGTTIDADNSAYTIYSFIEGIFTLSITSTLRLESYIQKQINNVGYGRAAGYGSEIYSQVEIEKIL